MLGVVAPVGIPVRDLALASLVLKRTQDVRGWLMRFLGVLLGLFMASSANAQPFAYVTNFLDRSVSMIDTTTNAVVATVAVGDGPLGVTVCEPSNDGGSSNALSIDNPQEGDIVSGNVAISGFHCQAQERGVRLQFDTIGTPTPIGLTQRADILAPTGPCDDPNDAFVVNFLWALLPEGPHQLKFFLGSASTPFRTLNVNVVHAQAGTEFLTGVAGQCTVEDFPAPGHDTIVEWRESLQNFTIAEVIPVP